MLTFLRPELFNRPMGDIVPALAHWRMSEIQCRYARTYSDHLRP